MLDLLSSTKYTVLYTTTPTTIMPHSAIAEPEAYQMDMAFSSQAHMELKRDYIAHGKRVVGDNITLPDGGLFERYQYFTPGMSAAMNHISSQQVTDCSD